MIRTWDEFPFKKVIGARFEASETGLSYTGSITGAYRDGDQIVFEHDRPLFGESLFSCAVGHGSWERVQGGIRVSIAQTGSYTIFLPE